MVHSSRARRRLTTTPGRQWPARAYVAGPDGDRTNRAVEGCASMDERDDPARRLKRAIERCIEQGQTMPGNSPAGDVIHAALGLGSAATAVGLLHRLFHDTRESLKALEGDVSVDSYLLGIGPIDAWLGSLNLTHRWDGQSAVDARALGALDICSDQIWRSRRMKVVAEDTLKAWREEAADLLAEVLKAAPDLDPAFRDFMVASLRGVVAAIDEYRIAGSAGLARVVAEVAGRFAVERPRPTNDTDLGRLKRLAFILATIAGASISVNQIAQTPANVLDAFNHLVEEVDELKELGPGPRELPPGGNASLG